MKTQLSWILVAVSYLSLIAFVLLVLLQLASGYSSSFFGWVPPNSQGFRVSVGVSAFVAIILTTVCGGIVWKCGRGDWPRTAAEPPTVVGLLVLIASAIGALT